MRKISLVVSLILCLAMGSKAQVVSTESFDNTTFAPVGWAVKPVVQTPIWVRVTTGTNPTASPHSGAGFARFRSGSGQVAAGTKQTLVTRPIDYTARGTNAANLSFWMYRDNVSSSYDSLRVFVSNVDSLDASAIYLGTIARNRTYAMPDTQAANAWYAYTYAIPGSFTNSTTTRFIFEGTSASLGGNQIGNIFIDDVSFDEFPAQCSGTPTVGNVVKSTAVICGGGGTVNLSLSAPIIGFSGITYVWEEAGSAAGPWSGFGTNAATVTSNNLTNTTYFRCVVTCSFSSLTYTTAVDSVIVSNNPAPTVSVSPSPALYCAGTAGATVIATGASTYAWSPALGLNTTTGATVIASPTANTQYTVVGTDSAGCAASTTVNVTIANPPNVSITATPSDSGCIGSTIILNSVPNGPTQGNIYLWSDGKTTRRDTIVVTANQTLSVIVTNQAGCSASDTISIIALPTIQGNFGYTVVGNTYSFIDSTIGSSNWVWDFGDGNGSFNQNPTYTFSQPGQYNVTLIVTTPCGNDTVTQTVYVYPLGVENFTDVQEVNVYPNPTNDLLQLTAMSIIQSVEVYNLYGQKVKTILSVKNEKQLAISVKELTNGMYMLRTVHDNGISNLFIIKK